MTQGPRIPILVLVVSLVSASCARSAMPVSPSDRNVGAPATLQVDDVVVLIAESYPAQVFVRVKGSLPDSCSAVDRITQSRDGNAVTVTIAIERTAGSCGPVAQPLDLSVRLNGGFESGRYTVVVSGIERTFRI